MWWSCSNYASISTCIGHAAQQWGSSPRNSYRLLLRAWPQVREDVKATWFDRQDKTYWIIHKLMTAAGEVVKKKHPSVTVGACRKLNALFGLGVNSSKMGRLGWRR